MNRTLLAIEPPISPDALREDLIDAGVTVVSESDDPADLAQTAVRHSADLVITASVSPSNALFEAAKLLGILAPCPFIVFTSDRDSAKIARASDCSIHSYVVDGYGKHRLLSIIQVARARFRQEQLLKEELRGLASRFDERKIVDRAKGVLMRSRQVTEDEAFALLRGLAMRTRQRIGIVAQSVIDMSRAGEAVNRAGQLRMLPQRIVRCYAQALCGFETETARQIITDCAARVDANLRILRHAISQEGYGERVERVAAAWQEVALLAGQPPELARLDLLDTRAEAMLREAESLTEFLGSSGLVASLSILNISGRQRMLSQRMTKLCFRLALDPDGARLEQLHGLMAQFQRAMEHLQKVPLSSPAILACLQPALAEWARLRAALDAIGDREALRHVAEASERLLDWTERLTDQYEQAMQVLIGDGFGRFG